MIKRTIFLFAAGAGLQACFASKSDFEALRLDVTAAQRRQASADSLQRSQLVQLASINRAIGGLSDSLRALNSRISSSRAMTTQEISGLRQDIARLQDVSGQSEERLREIRASIEEHAPSIAKDSTSPVGPGPAQLLQLGRDQMAKRSYTSAREALNDLLTRFPSSDLAADASFEIARSYAAENNPGAADSAYAFMASRFPNSPRIPSVLYKRGLILQSLGRQSEARRLFQEVTRRFPRSAEAALAQERLAAPR